MSALLVYGCVGGYTAVYFSYFCAYASSPKDPVFFYAFASQLSDSWTMLTVSTLFEVLGLTSAAAVSLFCLFPLLSYVLTMSSLLR